MKNFLIFCGVSLLFIVSGPTASAVSPKLKQQILPLNCVFETINDGTGTIHYLTPAACGQVIPTSPVPVPTQSPNVNLSKLPAAFSNKINTPSGSIENPTNFLNLNQLFTSGSGYAMTVKPGSAFTYLLPSDKPNSKPRSFIITAIGTNTVTLRFNSHDNVLTSGRINYIDSDGNSRPDIAMEVSGIVPDTSATMDCWLLVSNFKSFHGNHLNPEKTKQSKIHPLNIAAVLFVVYAATLAHRRLWRKS